MEDKKTARICPMCGCEMSDRPVMNAMSRYNDREICSDCGHLEAAIDMAGRPRAMPYTAYSSDFSGLYETESRTVMVVWGMQGYRGYGAEFVPGSDSDRINRLNGTDPVEAGIMTAASMGLISWAKAKRQILKRRAEHENAEGH